MTEKNEIFGSLKYSVRDNLRNVQKLLNNYLNTEHLNLNIWLFGHFLSSFQMVWSLD